MPIKKRYTKSRFLKSLYCVVALIFFIAQQNAFAQFSLPKSDLLRENGIKKIQVTKTAMRMEDGSGQIISDEDLDGTTMMWSTYFINPQGLIDSTYNFGGNTTSFDKYFFQYESKNCFSEIKRISPSGDEMEKHLVVRTTENELYYRVWQYGELLLEIRATADSIVYETVSRRSNSSYYHTKSYDIKNDIQTEATYASDSNEVIRKESYQWISNNGVPDRFIYTDYFRGSSAEEPRNKTKEFKVADDGSVINKLNGLFTDPFHMFNYFERHEQFKGIPNPHERLLSQNTFIFEKEDDELLSFDGKCIIYNYQITYE